MYLKLDESKWYRHTHEWSDRSKGLGRVDVYKGQIEVAEDVVPVVHAHWSRSYKRPGVYEFIGWYCTNCNSRTSEEYAPYWWLYCPHCGAIMDEKKEG